MTSAKYSIKDEDGKEIHGPARDIARRRLFPQKTKEEAREYNKQYYLKNLEKERARCNNYRKEHRAKAIENSRRFYYTVDKARQNANPAIRNARGKAWKKRNPEKVMAMDKVRRARKFGCKRDRSAIDFILFVRKKKSIPCYYCGKRIAGKDAHIDHVIALSRSGNHASDNLAASCADCNLRKSSRLPSQIDFHPQPLLNL